MPSYLVKMNISVAGIGSMNAQDKPIKRTVSANSIEDAVKIAQQDILMVEVTSVEKVPDA